ncbi:MAG TPA: glycosyltransferase family 4 protein [Nitrospira sp.]|nr:glycosyltransferase family 4 protein [Nitrospira sp.]
MKLLFITAAFPPMRAGESDHALQLCLRLAERGDSVHVVTTKTWTPNGKVPFTVYPLMSDWSWMDLRRLARFMKHCRPDAVFLMYSGWVYNDHPMITFIPTVAKRLYPAVPFVTMLAIDQGSSMHAWSSRLCRKAMRYWAGAKTVDYTFGTLLRDSDSVIALSEEHLARFCALSPAVRRKGLVMPPPPLMRMYAQNKGARELGRARLGVKEDDTLLAFFGYVDQTKGVETLFDAIKILSAAIPNIRLVMIGGGRGTAQTVVGQRARVTVEYEQAMLRYPETIGIADKVIWPGGYDSDSDEASLFLYAADACVLPFDHGVTLNRSSFAAAAAHGLPIITTKGERLESPFKDRENVLLCPPKNPKALASAIEVLLRDDTLQERLRRGAAQLTAQWFSWDRVIERTIQTLQAPCEIAS